MKKNLLKALLLVAIVFTMNSCSKSDSSADVTAPKEVQVLNYDYSTKETEMANLVNNYRVSQGLSPLILINHISHVSEGHDDYMIGKNALSHDLFQERYENLVSVLGATRVGENVAFNFNLPSNALNAWINSPGHKANIVGDYTHFGISIRVNSNGITYYTNLFMKK